MDLKVNICKGLDWIRSAQSRNQWWLLVNMVMTLEVS